MHSLFLDKYLTVNNINGIIYVKDNGGGNRVCYR